jgi:hypothetical protein
MRLQKASRLAERDPARHPRPLACPASGGSTVVGMLGGLIRCRLGFGRGPGPATSRPPISWTTWQPAMDAQRAGLQGWYPRPSAPAHNALPIVVKYSRWPSTAAAAPGAVVDPGAAPGLRLPVVLLTVRVQLTISRQTPVGLATCQLEPPLDRIIRQAGPDVAGCSHSVTQPGVIEPRCRGRATRTPGASARRCS